MDTQRALRNKAISDKRRKLRESLFPDVKEDDLWSRKTAKGFKMGFTTIPKTMPLFMQIMNAMSKKGNPVSSVYLSLWCMTMDDSMVDLKDKQALAFYSGFTGQRGVNTLNGRLDILNKLGFIRLAAGTYGDKSHALIMNPYQIVKRHHEEKTSGITDTLYNALVEQATLIKADDLD